MKSLLSNLIWTVTFMVMGLSIASCNSDDEPNLPNDENGDNGAYVDLGLSVKWATCNIGATMPEEVGSYYAWGETSTKSEYTETNYFDASFSKFKLSGTKKISGSNRDIAYTKLGKDWRMPTTSEINELIDACTWTNDVVNGVNGIRGTASNGNSIFFPITGMYAGTSIQSNSQGCYWGGELYSDAQKSSKYASMISFFKGAQPRASNYYRFEGMAIRPVYVKEDASSENGNGENSGSSSAKVEVSSISIGSKDKAGRYTVTITVKATKLSSEETVKTIGAKWGTVKGNPDSRDSRSSGTSASFTSAWHSGQTYYVTPFLKTNKTDGEITGATKSKKTP